MSQIFDPFILLRTIGPVRNRKQKSAQGLLTIRLGFTYFRKKFPLGGFIFEMCFGTGWTAFGHFLLL